MKNEKLCKFLQDNYCSYIAVTPTRRAGRDMQPMNDIELDAQFQQFLALDDGDMARDLADNYDLPVYMYEPLDCFLTEVDGNLGEDMPVHRIN